MVLNLLNYVHLVLILLLCAMKYCHTHDEDLATQTSWTCVEFESEDWDRPTKSAKLQQNLSLKSFMIQNIQRKGT